MSYAVIWRQDGQPEIAGRLELGDGYLVVTGRGREAGSKECRLRLAELENVHFERGLEGRRVPARQLVLESATGTRLELTSLEGVGALHELADVITAGRR